MTEAERRSAAIKARRSAPRPDEIDYGVSEPVPQAEWIDEGSVRDEAVAATYRASASPAGRTADSERVDPELVGEIAEVVGDQRAQRLLDRLSAASQALDRERFDEARRLVTPLVRELPGVAAVHEVAGLAHYRLGRWKQAAQELETARGLRESVELLPVLADAYRALRKWPEVDRVWATVKGASPSQDVMSEARIVVAGSFADRGEIKTAIELLKQASTVPKRVRDHHLRQWYALADLYDRAGDTMAATHWFRMVAAHDSEFVDVTDRLRSLGR